ncbi:MAG: hypothetical protein FD173_2002 [Gallionellaceae bacterium]|nr:MAG: hypothetical protein FD173_2002 [Gallionellaceae bacterium]
MPAEILDAWDPTKDFQKLDLSKMEDSDPRAHPHSRLHRTVRRGASPDFRISAVPYFGGCIHVPPPPSNQIIHVFPLKNFKSMDAIWISGVLEVFPSDTNMGSASYRMKAEVVEKYKNK